MGKQRKTGTRRYGLQTIFFALFAFLVAYVVFFHTESINEQATEFKLNTINSLYAAEVEKWAMEYDLPPEYFKSLIMLETSGRKKIPSRFEEHIFAELKAVQANKRSRFEHVSRRKIKDASDEALKNLASSWGPFQIMGYKCVELDISINELRGDQAIEHGMFWINKDYGKMLKRKQFKDAFHYHNTGKRYPKVGKSLTHDPEYVIKGLKYMEYFKQNPE